MILVCDTHADEVLDAMGKRARSAGVRIVGPAQCVRCQEIALASGPAEGVSIGMRVLFHRIQIGAYADALRVLGELPAGPHTDTRDVRNALESLMQCSRNDRLGVHEYPHFAAVLRLAGERAIEMLRAKDPPTVSDFEHIIGLVRIERQRQDEKYGGPKHDDEHSPEDWIRYIFDHASRARSAIDDDASVYVYQLVRVAALAFAALEAYYRAQAEIGR